MRNGIPSEEQLQQVVNAVRGYPWSSSFANRVHALGKVAETESATTRWKFSRENRDAMKMYFDGLARSVGGHQYRC